MYQITKTNTFKKCVKNYENNDKVIDRLKEIFADLIQGKSLLGTYKDHPLKGNFMGFRECHIFPNILLIYKINETEKLITLSYIGSHSDLF